MATKVKSQKRRNKRSQQQEKGLIEYVNPITPSESQPQYPNPQTEETITRERYLEILSHADLLQQKDFETRQIKALDSLGSLISTEEPKLPLQAVYRAAEILEINPEYIKQAIESTRLKDLSFQKYFELQSKNVQIIPDIDALRPFYVEQIVKILQPEFPLNKVIAYGNHYGNYDNNHWIDYSRWQKDYSISNFAIFKKGKDIIRTIKKRKGHLWWKKEYDETISERDYKILIYLSFDSDKRVSIELKDKFPVRDLERFFKLFKEKTGISTGINYYANGTDEVREYYGL